MNRMKRVVGGGTLIVLGLLVAQGAFAQEAEKGAPIAPFSRPGTEAGLSVTVEAFLGMAEGLAKGDAEIFGVWCQQYRIDPTWPSAQRLVSAFPGVAAEFGSRLNVARESGSFTGADGLDPNSWRTEAFGRAFGELYEELLLDGFDMELKPFLLVIQARMAPTVTSYSDEPFTEDKKTRKESQFWKGLSDASEHARSLLAEGGIQ